MVDLIGCEDTETLVGKVGELAREIVPVDPGAPVLVSAALSTVLRGLLDAPDVTRWRTVQPRFCQFCRLPAVPHDWTRLVDATSSCLTRRRKSYYLVASAKLTSRSVPRRLPDASDFAPGSERPNQRFCQFCRLLPVLAQVRAIVKILHYPYSAERGQVRKAYSAIFFCPSVIEAGIQISTLAIWLVSS